jgi:hypothetical protein
MGIISSRMVKSDSALVSVTCPSAWVPERKGKAMRIMKRRRCFDLERDVFIPVSYDNAQMIKRA